MKSIQQVCQQKKCVFIEAYYNEIMAIKILLISCSQPFMAKIMNQRRFLYRILKNPFDLSQPKSPKDENFVLYFGRLASEKGVDTLIKAASILKNVS